MARKTKRNNNTNPLTQQQRQVRPPRLSVRGQVTMNSMFQGNAPIQGLSTNGSGDVCRIFELTGAQGTGTDAVAKVVGLYQSYKYLPGTSYTYVPAVGVNTPGTISIAYITNPEMMVNFRNVLTSPNPDLAIFATRVRSIANCKTGPVWQSLTLNMDPLLRRPRYDVNNTTSATFPTPDDAARQVAVNEYERAKQGSFILAITGAPANTVISRDYVHKKVQAFELAPIGET